MNQLVTFYTLMLFNQSVDVLFRVGCVSSSAYNYVILLFTYLELFLFVLHCHFLL